MRQLFDKDLSSKNSEYNEIFESYIHTRLSVESEQKLMEATEFFTKAVKKQLTSFLYPFFGIIPLFVMICMCLGKNSHIKIDVLTISLFALCGLIAIGGVAVWLVAKNNYKKCLVWYEKHYLPDIQKIEEELGIPDDNELLYVCVFSRECKKGRILSTTTEYYGVKEENDSVQIFADQLTLKIPKEHFISAQLVHQKLKFGGLFMLNQTSKEKKYYMKQYRIKDYGRLNYVASYFGRLTFQKNNLTWCIDVPPSEFEKLTKKFRKH